MMNIVMEEFTQSVTSFCSLFESMGSERAKRLLALCQVVMEKAVPVVNNIQSQAILSPSFVMSWSHTTWCMLNMSTRIDHHVATTPQSLVDTDWPNMKRQANHLIVRLVNMAQPCFRGPCHIIPEHNQAMFELFFEQFSNVLNTIHDVYTQSQNTESKVDALEQHLSLAASELSSCLRSFKQFASGQRQFCFDNLRDDLIRASNTKTDLRDETRTQVVRAYAHLSYLLAQLAARAHGLKHHVLFVKTLPFEQVMADFCTQIYQMFDWLVGTSLSYNQPRQHILVTNNLFSIECSTLMPGAVVDKLRVQVDSAEMANLFQEEHRKADQTCTKFVPPEDADVAQLRVRIAGGGNEAKKRKHDCGSVDDRREFRIDAAFENELMTYNCACAHIVISTRERHPNEEHIKNTGQREIFYLRFTVQKLISSYTATTFWLYSNGVRDGWLIHWNDQKRMENHEFMEQLERYIFFHTSIKRTLSPKDLTFLVNMARCQECAQQQQPNFVTFKNLLCAHLSEETRLNGRHQFSVWRSILQLKQLLNDSSVNELWDRGVIHGLMSRTEVDNILTAQNKPVFMIRLSLFHMASICVSARLADSTVMHIIPFDVRTLQAQPLIQLLQNLASTQRISQVLHSDGSLLCLRSLLQESSQVHKPELGLSQVSTNVDMGSDTPAQTLSFVRTWHSIIACNAPATTILQQQAQPKQDFSTAIEELLCKYGKSKEELINTTIGLPEQDTPADSHITVNAEQDTPADSHITVNAEQDTPADSHITVNAEQDTPADSHITVNAEQDTPADSHITVNAEQELEEEDCWCSRSLPKTDIHMAHDLFLL